MKKKKVVIAACAAVLALGFLGSAGYIGYKKVGEPLKKQSEYAELKKQYTNSELDINRFSQEPALKNITNEKIEKIPEQTSSSEAETEESTAEEQQYTSYTGGGYTTVYTQEENNLIGWITVPGTSIDYPIVYKQGDNKYYLTHNCWNNYDQYGAIYLDGGNYVGSKNMTIFGHNMNTYYNTMFRGLLNFENKNFFNSHDTIYCDIGEGSTDWEVIGCMIANLDDEDQVSFNRCVFADDEDFIDYAEQMLDACKNKRDVSIEADDQLLTLVTCSYHYKNCRTVVICRRCK